MVDGIMKFFSLKSHRLIFDKYAYIEVIFISKKIKLLEICYLLREREKEKMWSIKIENIITYIIS